MTKGKVAEGEIHKVPLDVKKEILSSSNIVENWNNLTSLGRNEWICWITSAKKIETRNKRIERMKSDITKGKRRPCCWPGCAHR